MARPLVLASCVGATLWLLGCGDCHKVTLCGDDGRLYSACTGTPAGVVAVPDSCCAASAPAGASSSASGSTGARGASSSSGSTGSSGSSGSTGSGSTGSSGSAGSTGSGSTSSGSTGGASTTAVDPCSVPPQCRPRFPGTCLPPGTRLLDDGGLIQADGGAFRTDGGS